LRYIFSSFYALPFRLIALPNAPFRVIFLLLIRTYFFIVSLSKTRLTFTTLQVQWNYTTLPNVLLLFFIFNLQCTSAMLHLFFACVSTTVDGVSHPGHSTCFWSDRQASGNSSSTSR